MITFDKIDLLLALRTAWIFHQPAGINKDICIQCGAIVVGYDSANLAPCLWPCPTATWIMDTLNWPHDDPDGMLDALNNTIDAVISGR